MSDRVWNATKRRWETFMGVPITDPPTSPELDEAFLDGMRAAAEVLRVDFWSNPTRIILEEVARRAKSGNVRQKPGLAERSDTEASATPAKQGDAS